MEKDDKENDYARKKDNGLKHKDKKEEISEEALHMLEHLQVCTLPQLTLFLESKYDKISKDEKLLFKVNNAISKRLNRVSEELKESKLEEVKKCLERDGFKLSNNRIEELLKAPSQQNDKSLKSVHSNLYEKGSYYKVVKFILNQNTNNMKVLKFCPQPIPADTIYMPSFKRMKKDTLEIIEAVNAFQKKIKDIQLKP